MEIVNAGPLAQLQLAAGDQVVYTVPEGRIARISSIVISNPSTDTPDDVTVWIAGHADQNCLIPLRQIPALDYWPDKTPMDLRENVTIEALSVSGGVLTIIVNGIEVTA